ncbi:MAG: 50S ribosome-binding GTPase [Firmicutes bacterium]|nr:50S ribosome-binding GTPase [Bacillota bacterium]
MNTGYDKIEQAILNATDLDEKEKNKILAIFMKQREKKANVLITGATGVGKSSTINAMFNREAAQVGVGVDPETMQIAKFELGSLTLWDSPGLGDGKENDRRHSKTIVDMLHKKDENGDLLIDVVLVVLDGESRDLGTSYELITSVIMPNLHEPERLLIGINKVDKMLNGKYWNAQNSTPEPKLEERINEKVESVSKRIYEATNVKVEPVAYSAGYKEEDEPQEKPYNLSKLFCYLIEKIPREKRVTVMVESSSNESMWESDDKLKNYIEIANERTFGKILQDVASGITKGAAAGAVIGSFIPIVGTAIGGVIGGILGGFSELLGL